MEYRRLGSSGMRVSALGLGTNAIGARADRETSTAIIHDALELGVNFIDTANIYAKSESETIIGQALAGRRHEVVLTTKAGLTKGPGPNERGSSRRHLMQELEGSLRRLQTDYVDLYQIHTFDPETPLEETLRTLDDMVRSGKVRYIGASNYAAWELTKALGLSDKFGLNRFVSMQIGYSLADRTPENELVPACLDQGVGIIPYFPLAGGILTGKYDSTDRDGAPSGSRAITDPNFARYLTEERLELGREVGRLAEEAGCSAGVLSLSWLMRKPAVSTVIVGATRVEQLRQNAESVALKPEADLLARLDSISRPFRYGEPFAFFRLPPS
ncbi:aldo/keto reductase [Paenibacillus flagellatus]|uniref:Aldo/keto reductase n=1 Tax=Paenibacillus flagellatus TaxID=2211139 RepID=A0A2V5JXJ7_9BACL|nr:aldo/keto reductase [Paenibacillus flagellatus]PYI49934.1 aldo/keto reductase [Paenibacillus flagellatus]